MNYLEEKVCLFFKRSNPNKIFSNIASEYPRGNLLVPWQINNRPKPDNLLINNQPISEMEHYEVQKIISGQWGIIGMIA